MAQCRLTDPAAHLADPRMSAYFDGLHHPKEALLPRTGYVALIGDTMVGYIAGHRTRRYGYDGEVQYLFVAANYRRRGIASALLRLLAEWFQNQGIARVCVNVDIESPAALPFYTSHGASALTRHWWVWEDIGKVMAVEDPPIELVWPSAEYLPRYVRALELGWSPDNLRPEASLEHLARINENADRFLAQQIDRDAKGPPITLPGGAVVPRLPGYSLWIWDGDFCGAIGFRWQRGTTELPPYCLGHIGYSVVPWKRNRGYATRALQLLLPHARAEGLAYVELTTDADNLASRRVIEANGGEVVERFYKPAEYGGAESLRYRITLSRKDISVTPARPLAWG